MATERKRRRLKDLQVQEVSLVSLGANQPAKVLLYKSADEPASESTSDAIAEPNTTPATPASTEKSMTENIDKTAELEALAKSLQEKLAAAESAASVATAKAAEQTAELAKRDEAVKKAERESLVTKTVAEVKDAFKAVPKIKFQEFGEKVVELREANPELAKYFEAALKGANDALSASSMFQTVGSTQKSDESMTAEQAYDGLVAKAIADSGNKLNRAQAAMKVLATAEGAEAYDRLAKADSK